MAPKPAIHRSVNKWAARIVPLLLAGIVGYVTWVYIALLAGMSKDTEPKRSQR